MKELLKNKEDIITGIVFLGVILFFYTIGLYYTALIFIVFGMLSIVILAIMMSRSTGSVNGLMFVPAGFSVLIGLILLIIDSLNKGI